MRQPGCEVGRCTVARGVDKPERVELRRQIPSIIRQINDVALDLDRMTLAAHAAQTEDEAMRIALRNRLLRLSRALSNATWWR